MKKYIKPDTDIIPSMTAERLLLDGSYVVNDFGEKPDPDPDIVGGDEVNTFNKSLWDEE